MLLGRGAEQRVLDGLLRQARGGRSAVLVLRGEPGIGKTALLDYAQANAPDMTVLRCVGIEAEHEFPFAGLQQLLRPCLGLLDRLPGPQAANPTARTAAAAVAEMIVLASAAHLIPITGTPSWCPGCAGSGCL